MRFVWTKLLILGISRIVNLQGIALLQCLLNVGDESQRHVAVGLDADGEACLIVGAHALPLGGNEVADVIDGGQAVVQLNVKLVAARLRAAHVDVGNGRLMGELLHLCALMRCG